MSGGATIISESRSGKEQATINKEFASDDEIYCGADFDLLERGGPAEL